MNIEVMYKEEAENSYKSKIDEIQNAVLEFASFISKTSDCGKVITDFNLSFRNPEVVYVDISFFDRKLDVIIEGKHTYIKQQNKE